MYPVLLEFGPFTVYSYGVMMALGFVAAAWLLGKGLAYQGRNPDLASTLVLWAAVGGLLGARLLFILDNWSAFLADPWALSSDRCRLCVARWLGWRYRRRQCVHPALSASVAGDHGCDCPGDCSGSWYRTPGLPISWRRGLGTPNRLPWGMAYPAAIVGWDYPPDVFVHPTPLYEMVAYFAIAALLWSRRTSLHRPGSLFWGYLLLAGIARFFLEFVRVNPPLLGEFSQAQVLSIGLMLVGTSFLFTRKAQRLPAVHNKMEKSR